MRLKMTKLAVSGECASTKGKSKVNGGIVADGEDVAGNFVAPRPNLEITQSSGEFAEGQDDAFNFDAGSPKGRIDPGSPDHFANRGRYQGGLFQI